jgi:hypothetical protein
MEDYSQISGSETCESLKYKIVEYQEKVRKLRKEKGL